MLATVILSVTTTYFTLAWLLLPISKYFQDPKGPGKYPIYSFLTAFKDIIHHQAITRLERYNKGEQLDSFFAALMDDKFLASLQSRVERDRWRNCSHHRRGRRHHWTAHDGGEAVA